MKEAEIAKNESLKKNKEVEKIEEDPKSSDKPPPLESIPEEDEGKDENFIVIPITVFNKSLPTNLGKELLSPSFFRKIPY